MSDATFEINSEGGIGTNPISQAGRVVINGHRDCEQIANNEAALKKGTSYYPGPIDDDSSSIFPREPVFTRKMNHNRKRKAKSEATYFLSTTNGGFHKSQSHWEIVGELEFPGFAGSRAKADRTNKSPEVDFTVVIGGLLTIVNTGPDRINNGDAIYIDIPDPENPFEIGRKNSTRQVLLTMPFKPTEKDQITEDTLLKILAEPRDSKDRIKNQPIYDAAEALHTTILTGALTAWDAALSTGLFSLDAIALSQDIGEHIRTANILEYEAHRPAMLKKLGAHLGLFANAKDRKNGQREMLTVRSRKLGKSTAASEETLQAYVSKTMLGKDSAYYISRLTPDHNGRPKIPQGHEGYLMGLQTSFLNNLLTVVHRGNEYKKRRIVARALSPADKGKELDVLVGRFCT